MSAAEHRKPCELRGSRTVLGARGGETPPRDSPIASFAATQMAESFSPSPTNYLATFGLS